MARAGDVRVGQHPGAHPATHDEGEGVGFPAAGQHREASAGAGAAGHHPPAQEARRRHLHRGPRRRGRGLGRRGRGPLL